MSTVSHGLTLGVLLDPTRHADPPGSANPSRRAVTLTPSPMSPASVITSPWCMPTRNSMRQARTDGSRQPVEAELTTARNLGSRLARVARRLKDLKASRAAATLSLLSRTQGTRGDLLEMKLHGPRDLSATRNTRELDRRPRPALPQNPSKTQLNQPHRIRSRRECSARAYGSRPRGVLIAGLVGRVFQYAAQPLAS
jgi:hypothetical protein